MKGGISGSKAVLGLAGFLASVVYLHQLFSFLSLDLQGTSQALQVCSREGKGRWAQGWPDRKGCMYTSAEPFTVWLVVAFGHQGLAVLQLPIDDIS